MSSASLPGKIQPNFFFHGPSQKKFLYTGFTGKYLSSGKNPTNFFFSWTFPPKKKIKSVGLFKCPSSEVLWPLSPPGFIFYLTVPAKVQVPPIALSNDVFTRSEVGTGWKNWFHFGLKIGFICPGCMAKVLAIAFRSSHLFFAYSVHFEPSIHSLNLSLFIFRSQYKTSKPKPTPK